MSLIIGRQIEAGVAVEEVRGTAETTATRWVRKTNIDLIPQAEHAIDETTFGRLEDSIQRRVTRKWVEGDLSGNVHADAIGYLLYSLYGSVTSAVVSGSVYEHEFELLQDTEHPTLSLFVKEGDVDQYVVNGVVPQSLEISAEQNGYVTFTSSLMGRDYADNSDTPSYGTEYDFIGRDITIKLAQTEGGLAGATPLKAKNITLTWTPNTEANFLLGSYNPDDIYNKQFALEGEIELDYVNQTFLDAYLSDGPTYALITIEGAADIGGGNNPKLEILLNKSMIMDRQRADQANGLVQETVSFKAFYNTTDEQQSKVTLVNLTSEYDPNTSA